ncbi:DUF6343 family protein [Streptomyces sp. NPDC040750]|uniref:DUF6343 family protein n=1 Tax=Streptomyces sp. NPDC040750 TaxID=3154491 RepID=UPI0033E0B23F
MRDNRHGRAAEPIPRLPSETTGRRSPRAGTEPATARSALGLRMVLSAAFLPLFAAATAGFAVWAVHQGTGGSPGSGPLTVLAAICGILALAAAVDLVVLTARRRRRERADGAARP